MESMKRMQITPLIVGSAVQITGGGFKGVLGVVAGDMTHADMSALVMAPSGDRNKVVAVQAEVDGYSILLGVSPEFLIEA